MALILSLPSRQMHILTFLNPDVRMCVIICNAGLELEIDVNSSDKTGMVFFFFFQTMRSNTRPVMDTYGLFAVYEFLLPNSQKRMMLGYNNAQDLVPLQNAAQTMRYNQHVLLHGR